MFFKNCLSYVLVVFIIQTKCYKTFYDRPEIDPALTDTGLCYFFAYDDVMHPDVMKEIFSTAQLYRKAILLGYSLYFVRIGERPDEMATTLVKDKGDARGFVYSVSTIEYEEYRDRSREYNGQQILRSDPFTVQFHENGKNITVRCNTLVTVETPIKKDPIPNDNRPTKQYLNIIIEALIAAHMDKDYIEIIANFPTQ